MRKISASQSYLFFDFDRVGHCSLSLNVGIKISVYAEFRNFYNKIECLDPPFGALRSLSASREFVALSITGFEDGSAAALAGLRQQFRFLSASYRKVIAEELLQ